MREYKYPPQAEKRNFDLYKGSSTVHIAGIMAMCDFLLAPLMAIKLGEAVDYLVLRYDTALGHNGDGEGGWYHYKLLTALNPFKIPVVHMTSNDTRPGMVGQELLGALDEVKPEYVFLCDSDETMDFDNPLFWQEFRDFKEKQKDYMFFEEDMVTEDGRAVPLNPIKPHSVIYRWREPGLRFARATTTPAVRGTNDFGKGYRARLTKLKHYCFYTKEIQEMKEKYYLSRKRKPNRMELWYWYGNCYDEWIKKYGSTKPENEWLINNDPP